MHFEVSDQDKLTSQLLNNLGIAISNEAPDAMPTALAMVRRAYRLNPLDVGRMLNLASLLTRVGEDNEAEHFLTSALKISPKLWLAWQIMGFIRTNAGDLPQAIDCFKRAYDIDPENGQRKFDLAAAYMRAGDFARGLPLYEFRHEILPKSSPLPPAPTWDGSKTGHLAVWCDQGTGDRIMFARWLPWAKERADKITLLTDPSSVSLLVGYSSVCDLACGLDAAIKFDHQIAIGSLPIVYGMTSSNIPPDPGLLAVAKTEGTLGAPGLKIGIVWYGNPAFPGNDVRTVPFHELLPLAADPRNTVFSLQVGPRSGDIARARAQRIVHDMAGQIEGDWSHTAAVIQNLDLVVSSCTAVAHLAGALGKTVFTLIPRFSDWRWLWGREDTPWYPHMRLFRQTKAGEWKSVVDKVIAAVDQLHQRRSLIRILSAPPTGFHKEPDVESVLRRVLQPGDCFVDVGANVGLHTLSAAELVGPEGTVLAFEPGENALDQLRSAIAGLPQVEIVAQPLWSMAEDIPFHLCADGSGGNAIWNPGIFPGNLKSRANVQRTIRRATTLDAEIGVRGLKPKVIKIDTEGAEQRVLQGAVELLLSEDRPPFIVAELHEFGLKVLGCSQASLRDFMQTAGYETFLIFTNCAKPRHVPPGQNIQSTCIVNLLFSTQGAVDSVWPGEEEGDLAADGILGHRWTSDSRIAIGDASQEASAA